MQGKKNKKEDFVKKEGDISTITEIKSLSYSASGVARYEGKVVFIPYTVTGDVVRFSICRDRKTYADGKLEEVLKSSPYRRTAPCPYFERCGGCQWQHIAYNYQLHAKKVITKDLLERIGDIKIENISETQSANGEWNYRQRVRFQVGFTDGKPSFGFSVYGSNNVVDIHNCHIVQKPIAELIKELSSRKNAIKNFYDFEVYYSEEGSFVFYATARENWEKDAVNELLPFFKGGTISDKRAKKVYNIKDPSLNYPIKNITGDYKLKVQAGGFVQSNPYVNELILNVIADELRGFEDKVLLELFAGSGNFSIPLSRLMKHVIAVEGDTFSYRALEENIPRNRVINITSVRANVYDEIVKYFNKKRNFGVIFLDPPRIGAKDIMPFLPKFEPERILYLSCNPSTLARDVKVLCDAGYRITKLIPFDMFPQTFHIECLAILDKNYE
ncbi:MAG: 23S rRNA (uracil(1939)-C(5))-methyltransferase RlmD [bacterium]